MRPAVKTAAFRVEALCRIEFAALGMEGTRAATFSKFRRSGSGFLAKCKGIVITTHGLEDGDALAMDHSGIKRESLGMIEIL